MKCQWFQLSFSGTRAQTNRAVSCRCCVPLCRRVFVCSAMSCRGSAMEDCILLSEISWKWETSYSSKDEGECWSCDSSAEKLNQVLSMTYRLQYKCVCVCVRARLNFKCAKQWVQCDSFTWTRPQASLGDVTFKRCIVQISLCDSYYY